MVTWELIDSLLKHVFSNLVNLAPKTHQPPKNLSLGSPPSNLGKDLTRNHGKL